MNTPDNIMHLGENEGMNLRSQASYYADLIAAELSGFADFLAKNLLKDNQHKGRTYMQNDIPADTLEIEVKRYLQSWTDGIGNNNN